MSGIGSPERATQDRVLALFTDELGYRYLGDWTHREGNSNVDEALLTRWLSARGHSGAEVAKALLVLRTEAGHPNRNLYENSKAVYGLLRYGVGTKVVAGRPTETVKLVDWEHPELNDFAVAEEVTLRGDLRRRPDLVLYLNGIAVGVIELKNSRVSIATGIRQNLQHLHGAAEGCRGQARLVED